MPTNAVRGGFSLVELSIALVIIGLLVGSILGGRSLIRSTQINTIAQNKGALDGTAMAFYEQYGQFPGDMSNATSHWNGVTNGNGDFIIASGGATIPGQSRENLQFWNHLSKSGLMEGEYAGVILDPHWYEEDVNLYAISSGIAASMQYIGIYPQKHWLVIAGLGANSSGKRYLTNNTSSSYTHSQETLSQEELWLFDKKYDDGADNSGLIRSPSIGTSCGYDTYAEHSQERKCLLGWVPAFGKLLRDD